MGKRVLVAGAAGFLGRHLCEYLLQKNYSVWAIDNLSTGSELNLKIIKSLGVQFVRGDINNPEHIQGEFDEIYNLASPASPVDFKKFPVFILNTAAIGHYNLLELARKTGAKVFFASSSEVYGDAKEHPQKESYTGNVNISGPRASYDEAKRYGESLSLAYNWQYGVKVRIARIFNTYGPGMRWDDGRIIPNFFAQALKQKPLPIYGEGKQTRSFCYVTDLIQGIFDLMQSDMIQPVNLGNPEECSVLELAERVNDLTGNRAGFLHLPCPKDDPGRRCPDISLAQSLLSWQPTVDLNRGLNYCNESFQKEFLA